MDNFGTAKASIDAALKMGILNQAEHGVAINEIKRQYGSPVDPIDVVYPEQKEFNNAVNRN